MAPVSLARRAALALSCLLLVSAVSGVVGQPPWAVYLLDTGARALVRVNGDGAQAVYPLGLPENAYVSAFDIGFSPDGTRVALCPVDYGNAETAPSAQLIVRDIAAQAELMRLDLGPALGCRVTYRSDGAFLAVGIVHYIPGDVQAVPDLPAWELRVVEPGAGNTIAVLRADGPEAAAVGVPSNPPVLPVVRRFEGAELIFAALPFAAGGPGLAPAFTWRVDAAALTPAEPWGYLQFDALAGGDLAWNTGDPGRPAGQAPGSLPAANVTRWQDASAQPRTVFTSPDWLLLDTRFIDDGARLALHLVAPFDAAQPESVGYATRWIALDRAGAVDELTSDASYAQVRGAPGGYVVLQAYASPGGATVYTLDYNSGGQIRTLWNTEAQNTAYDLAWAPPMTLAPGLPPFAALP
jgi:hypothetical protein